MQRIELLKETGKKKGRNILIWMESPSNPQCKVVDIEAVSQWTNNFREKMGEPSSHGEVDIVTVVDSTWSPPTITKPLLVRFI